MFLLSTFQDRIPIQPRDLHLQRKHAVAAVVNALYLDKVIHDVGLAVTIYDIIEVKGGHLYPSEGAPFFDVKFRLVVFRPFMGEVLEGTVSSLDR